jgi:hypothetical protein
MFLGETKGGDKKEAPKDAKSVADIMKAIESIKGFGQPATAEFKTAGKQTFVVWYCPYSGRAACHVHAYCFDGPTGKWHRFLDQVYDGTIDVLVQSGGLSGGLTIRDTKGAVLFTEKKE